MSKKRLENKKTKYMNEFPVIILVAIVIIIIILVMMYLKIKPYETIYRNGYMVLSNNMTYNLISDNFKEEDKLSVGVAPVSNGDYIYKQTDTYYVGVEKKIEVDYDYPIYSKDGLTIYNLNEDVVLIDRNFEKLKGYPGFSLNHGILYNEGDEEPADEVDYLFLYLNNSIYINAQVMVIKTSQNEHTIPIHSPVYFDTEYINYYVFDGKEFGYNTITDIYYDSLIKIGDVTLTYSEFLIQMGLVELKDLMPKEEGKEDENEQENNQIEIEPGDNEIIEIEYVKPTVMVSELVPSVYFVGTQLTINDPSGVITASPTFEIYTMDNKLYSRKKFNYSGEIKISGLSSNTQYKIIGTYKYENENATSIVSTFYEGVITTKDVSTLAEIKLDSALGDIYPNKIEIKNLNILNKDIEAVSGIKKIVLSVWKENEEEIKQVNLSYSEIRNLINGEKITIRSLNNLSSNTVYEYNLKIYDKEGNELKCSGNSSGKIKTSKEDPTIKTTIDIDKKNNIVDIDVRTNNVDNIFIKDFKYELYNYAGYLLDEGALNYENQSLTELAFDNLDYNTNYILKITGTYDLEDGKGERELIIEKDFTTANLSSNFVAWYEIDTLEVTYESIRAEVFISSNTVVLEKNNTEVIVSLVDKEGNDILNDNGELKYLKKYTKEEYTNSEYSSYYMQPLFENLDSGTEYNIKVQIIVKQLEDEIILEKILTPSITTDFRDAYINVINKKLVGNDLDITLEINDPEGFVDENGVIVEIYEGEYSDASEIKERYVYRERFEILNSNIISFRIGGYTSDRYTILVSSNPYNNINVQKNLSVLGEEEKNVINVNRQLDAYVEMYQQLNNSNKLNTEISFRYNLYETITDIYFIDCVDSVCTNLGYIDTNNQFNKVSTNVNGIDTNSDNKQIVSILNEKRDYEHTFYLAIQRNLIDLKNIQTFNESSLNIDMYILDYLEYSTNYEIFNINHAGDFFDTSLIKKDKEIKHYVVTDNIMFGDGISKLDYTLSEAYFTNFQGTIDFQGYSVELHRNVKSTFVLFSSVAKQGVLKNVVLNYNLDYDGIMSSTIPGLVNMNNGTLENFIANVTQTNENGRGYGLGLMAYSNFGTINNFAIYLKTDVHIYYSSSLVTYSNAATGVISNGYLMTDPNQNASKKIIIHDLTYQGHGTFTNENHGTIKNIYNLVSIECANNQGMATIARVNRPTGVIKNAISVATITQHTTASGPNIWVNYGGEISNNYYVETNINNASYTNNFNTKINRATLMNASAWEVILNSDNSYSITLGYYPILKMSRFMQNKQQLVKIPFDYFGETMVDILSTEVINSNIDGMAQAKVYVSNPNKYDIKAIDVDGLTTQIASSIYDESMQATVINLNLTLGSNDIAKSSYYITGIKYSLEETDFILEKKYDDKDYRMLYIDMYRKVDNYDNFVDCIETNQNIYLTQNIEVNNVSKLPKASGTYSAILDGNEKYINFNDLEISRGYFLYSFKGTLQNLQIANLKLNAASSYTGFIRNVNNANIINVDITNASINMNISSKVSNMYIGTLVGYSEYSNLYKTSINDTTITNSYSGSYADNVYIGGLIGYANYSEVENSYVYNINITDMKKDDLASVYALGGVLGHGSNSNIRHCYTTGQFDTEYSRVGGIIGNFSSTYVIDTYSYIRIKTTGNYIGGIAGSSTGSNSGSIANNMYIGQLVNRGSNTSVSLITTAGYTTTNSNYTLLGTSGAVSIDNKNNLTQFDEGYFYFTEDTTVLDLPYLIETSFVDQQIKNDLFIDFNENNIEYEITYSNPDESCVNNQILDVNTGSVITSALYSNACATEAILTINNGYQLNYEFNNGVVETNDLKITKQEENVYKLEPIKYLNYYELNVKNLSNSVIDTDIKVSFYRKINDKEDWNDIQNLENIILINDIDLNSGEVLNNKKISNFLGNGKTIKGADTLTSPNNLINLIVGTMRDVSFENFTISGTTELTGLIKFNEGTIENCKFSNINISSSKSKTAIISTSSGYVRNINLSSISVSGGAQYTAALVAFDNSGQTNKTNIEKVYAIGNIGSTETINKENIVISGTDYVGGIVGKSDYNIKDIYVDGLTIQKGNSYVAGISGYGNCSNAGISNAEIYVTGNYVGGIGVQHHSATLSNLKVSNLKIIEYEGSGDTTNSHIGGVYANGWYFSKVQVNNLQIVGENNGNFNANNVGGIGSRGGRAEYILINDSKITGNSSVGGLFGYTLSYTSLIEGNLVLNSNIIANNDSAGGLIGSATGIVESPNTNMQNNIVTKSTISSKTNAGGLIGNLNNSNTVMQSIKLNNNLVTGVNIESIDISGGVIGRLHQIPSASMITYNNNFFHSDTYKGPLIGNIENRSTGADSGYGSEELSEDDFYILSNFKQYVTSEDIDIDPRYQINSIYDLEYFINNYTSAYKFPYSADKKYFPIFNSYVGTYPYLVIPPEDYIEIIYDSNVGILGDLSASTLMMSRSFRSYSRAYSNPVNIDYDVYSSDINKVNIEFSSVDRNTYFYYEVGDYVSEYIPIEKRTYTLTYDYKNPINIYVTNGSNYKESVIKPEDLAKTATIINGETYYINNGVLYSESKMIVGNFKNLYRGEALTSDGKIYNIESKQEADAYINYNILPIDEPLYEFVYDGNYIKTYYNYSTVNGVEKDYQLFVKNGNLNSISNYLNNKKNMYIIDYYNNNEIQIILKNDGKLYSVKYNINYPDSIINKDISELYTDISSTSTIAVLKYTNGAVYTFNYNTGEVLFTNVSNEHVSFLEYVKDKVGAASKYNVIENISGHDKYREIELLKNKIEDTSLDEARDKIYNSNNSIPNNEKYITMYNELTKTYDVYKISSLLNVSDVVESETEKMYQNYELVQFYKTLGKTQKKNSLSGIVIFAISIISVLVALTLLIKHKLNKKGGIA